MATATTEAAGITSITTITGERTDALDAVLEYMGTRPGITVRVGDSVRVSVGDHADRRDFPLILQCVDDPAYAEKIAGRIRGVTPKPKQTSMDCPTCDGPTAIAGEPCDGCAY